MQGSDTVSHIRMQAQARETGHDVLHSGFGVAIQFHCGEYPSEGFRADVREAPVVSECSGAPMSVNRCPIGAMSDSVSLTSKTMMEGFMGVAFRSK